jgi:multiple antibiotic resistance protein
MWLSMLTYAVGTAAALFPVVNPIGAVPVFYSLLGDASAATRGRQMWRTTLYTLAILVVSLFAGREILELFDISLAVLKVAGGLLVGYAGWRMATGANPAGQQPAATGADIAFVPMALPILAGPGAIGLLIGLAADYHGVAAYVGGVLGITAIAVLVYVLLRIGEPLTKLLGAAGIEALTRLMGLLILSIGVALIAEGVRDLAQVSGPTIPP